MIIVIIKLVSLPHKMQIYKNLKRKKLFSYQAQVLVYLLSIIITHCKYIILQYRFFHSTLYSMYRASQVAQW